MNLFFGTLAIASLFPATALAQGVLVLPQLAGPDNGATSESATVAPAISAPIRSPAPAQSPAQSPASIQNPVSIKDLAAIQSPAPAASSPGILVLAQSAPSRFTVLPQPAASKSVTNNEPLSGSIFSPTTFMSVISATTPLSAQSGLSTNGAISQSASGTLSASTTPFLAPNGPSSSGIISNSAASLATSPLAFSQSLTAAFSSVSSMSDQLNVGVKSESSKLSVTMQPSTMTVVLRISSAVSSGAVQSELPMNGGMSDSGSLVGTQVASSVGAPAVLVAEVVPSPHTATVNDGASNVPDLLGSVSASGAASAQVEDKTVPQTAAAAPSGAPNIVLAQNSEPNNSTASQAQACQNPGGVNGIDPSCWNILDMSNYVNTWWNDNNAKCGGVTAKFSTCFWELHNLGTRDCTSVTPGACPEPDTAGLSAQDWYIAYNIYAIAQVFSSLYQAIGNANTLASETVGQIVALIDPPQKDNVLAGDILTAISAAINIILPIGTLVQRHLIALTQQTPPVSKYLFPVGTTQSQVTQWSAIQGELGTIVHYYQNNVSQIIPTINNNIDLFTTFAESGAFSVNPLPNLSSESDKLLLGLNTFVISKAFQANNLVIGQATHTDINQLVRNSSSSLAFDTGCPGYGYDSEGLCGSFYYDQTVGHTFSLDNLGDMRKDYTEQLETVLQNWTTGDMLFGGAYRCQNDGGVQGTLAGTVIQTNGNVTLDCLSDIKVCEWNLASLDVNEEFTDCPSQRGYVSNGCIGCPEGSLPVNVPHSYLGAYLVNPGDQDCVCNT